MLESKIMNSKANGKMEMKTELKIQKKLKLFREQVLQKTLKDLANESGINLKTISAFENGRSNNINHLKIYAEACSDNLEFLTLIHLIKESLEEVRK